MGTTDPNMREARTARICGSKSMPSRSHHDAEMHALALLRMLLTPGGSKLFPSLAAKHSECPSSLKAKHLAGDCGWVARRNAQTAGGACRNVGASSIFGPSVETKRRQVTTETAPANHPFGIGG